MRYTILLIIILCFNGLVFAQKTYTLSGTVTDKVSGKSISGVAISIPELNINVSTNKNGNYIVENLSQLKFKIQISHVGYVTASDSISLENGNVYNVTLELDTKVLNEVFVTGNSENGYRNKQVQAGPLGALPLKDTPLSLNVTSGELISNRNVHSIAEALQTNPTVGVLMQSNTYSSMSRVMVRGFSAADQSELRDGVTDRSFTYVNLENVERVEVLNGLSSFMYGFSALGGTVNYVSKQPTATPLATLGLGVYGGGIRYVHADLGGPATTDGRLGYRVNAYQENGGTYINGSKQNRTMVSGVFDYRIGNNTHIKADITEQDLSMQGLQTYFLPAANATVIPAAFNPKKQYGQPWTSNESNKTQVGIGFESKINSIFSLRAAFRYNDMWRKYYYIAAQFLDDHTYSEKYWDSPRQFETTQSGYAYLDAKFNTSSVKHVVTFGYAGNDYLFKRGVDVNVVLGNSTMSSPASYPIMPDSVSVLTTYGSQDIRNLQLNDRIIINESLQAFVGVNYSTLHQTGGGVYTGWSTSNFRQSKFSPNFSLVYKPVAHVSVYGSYMQGLVVGGTAPTGSKNAGQMLTPSVNTQYEIGSKASFGRLDFTMALFRINAINSYVDPADNVYKQDGREVHQGVEMTMTGKVTNRLTVVGGFTLMQAKITREADNPAIDGKVPVNVPRQQVRLYIEYLIPELPHVTVTGSFNYFGDRPANVTNTLMLPGASTFDAGLRYQPTIGGHKATINLTASNLLNKYYWANYRTGDGLQLGLPRIISLGLRFNLQKN